MTSNTCNFKKAGIFTDIHFGRKNNSEIHNQDCIDYINWFIDKCKNEKVDHVIFMGDWFEHRNSISGITLKYSHEAMNLLKGLNLPIFFIVGNHDLVFKNTRNAFNTLIFEPFNNLNIVNEPLSITNNSSKLLFCPYLFESEYKDMVKKINQHDIIFGHFEFKGFIVTGESRILDHGPDHTDFKKPKRIFTGHFHKRQEKNNVVYIGNCFPMDFSDANDSNRGMALYEYENDNLEYINWEDSPKYIKSNISEVLDDPKEILKSKSSVNCLVDIDLDYEEALELKKKLETKFNLRELTLEEPLTEFEVDENELNIEDIESKTTDEIVVSLLGKIESENIDNKKLQKIYKRL